MKKLFVSCPMNGRTKEQILKSCHIEEDIISEMDIPHYEVDLRAIAPDLYATAVPNNKKHDVYVLRKRTEED